MIGTLNYMFHEYNFYTYFCFSLELDSSALPLCLRVDSYNKIYYMNTIIDDNKTSYWKSI